MSDEPEVPTDEARRFTNLLDRVLRVSKDELKRREAEYRKDRERKPDNLAPRSEPTPER